jgi:pimeloyl-ACP methyl ester carboxylesterase
MPRTFRVLLAAVSVAVPCAAWVASAQAASTCAPDGPQGSGAIYRICMPDTWNGDLVVFAHGYVAFNEPVAIPEGQLVLPDGTSIPGLVNDLGFAFATTSYSTNGLAVLQGVDDVVDLVTIFNATHGLARRVYLVGPSEGGLVTALALERHPDVFSGGVSACGPIGSFPHQIYYIGDYRLVFEYFFPGLIPGDPIDVPSTTIDAFYREIVPRIQEAIREQPDRVRQLLSVMRAPFDPDDPATVEHTLVTLAWYAVFTSNDATDKLGGYPYGNRLRRYTGSDDDVLLNQGILRVSSDFAAFVEMQRYQTTGRLLRPLVTLHTTGDQIVPYWHQQLYSLKTLLNGTFLRRHIPLAIDRYGHCNFRAPEVLAGLAIVVFMVSLQDVSFMASTAPVADSGSDPGCNRTHLCSAGH